MKRILKLVLGAIGVLIAMCLIGGILGRKDGAVNGPPKVAAPAKAAEATPEPPKSPQKEPQAEPAKVTAKEHLAAARAALANGYDTKRKWGGDLTTARQHIAAVGAAEPEAGEAKTLRSEIEAREAREKVITCDCELVKGKLVVNEESDEVADRLESIELGGPSTLKYNAREWFALPEVEAITVVEYGKYTDTRGNEKRVKVGEFTVTRARAKTINWDNITTLNILKSIDKRWTAPGVLAVRE